MADHLKLIVGKFKFFSLVFVIGSDENSPYDWLSDRLKKYQNVLYRVYIPMIITTFQFNLVTFSSLRPTDS